MNKNETNNNNKKSATPKSKSKGARAVGMAYGLFYMAVGAVIIAASLK